MKRIHLKKIKKPNLQAVKAKVPKRFRRSSAEERTQEAIQSLPRITNETVAEHREEVLRGARKYIYPLEHSKHRIVIISTALLVVAVIGFFVYCGLALYKFQSTNAFIYRITQVLPFPVARAGNRFVAYENYLFELRRSIHYYETQQKIDLNGKISKPQLTLYKQKALQQVIDAAYVKQLAAKHNVRVSEGEVNAQLDALRAQNHLGSSNQELADVANEFFGWSLDDLRREIKQELLARKVAATLDTAAQTKANAALQQLQGGANFADLAKQVSEDVATKDNGGQYADTAITTASTDVPPMVVRTLQSMKVGEVSKVISTSNTLEIVKLTSDSDGKLQAAHISFNVKNIAVFIAELEKTKSAHRYIPVK